MDFNERGLVPSTAPDDPFLHCAVPDGTLQGSVSLSGSTRCFISHVHVCGVFEHRVASTSPVLGTRDGSFVASQLSLHIQQTLIQKSLPFVCSYSMQCNIPAQGH